MVDTPEPATLFDRVPTPVVASVLILGVVGTLLVFDIGLADFVAFYRSDAAFPTTLGLFVFFLAVYDWRRRAD